jgi:hypothetical protein
VLELQAAEHACGEFGFQAMTLGIRRSEDIGPALAGFNSQMDALYVCSDTLVGTTNGTRINMLSLVARLPTVHRFREHVEVGGLISCSERDARDDDFARGRMKRCFHQNCPIPAGLSIFGRAGCRIATIEPLKLMQRF